MLGLAKLFDFILLSLFDQVVDVLGLGGIVGLVGWVPPLA